MGLQIQDATGNNYGVKVTEDGQLATVSQIHELQHAISWHSGNVYQIKGYVTGALASENVILHIKNTSSTLWGVISYMRIQAMSLSGGTSVPSSASEFEIGFGREYSSGGELVTPVNMNAGSGNIPDIEAYKENPTLTGTFLGFDDWYCDDGMMTFNKHGSLLLQRNNTMEIRFKTDHTKGKVYARVTIMMISPDAH